MTPFTTSLYIVAGVCLAVAVLHLTVGLRRFRPKLHLAFALLAATAAADALVSPLKYHPANIEGFAELNALSVHFQAAFALALTWFLWAYAEIRTRIAPLLMTAVWLLHEVFQSVLPYGIHFRELTGLREIVLPWGEKLLFGVGTPGPWLWVGDLLGGGVSIYGIAIAVHLWRSGDRRKAKILAIGLAPLVLLGVPNTIFLMDRGIIAFPNLYTFAFLSLVLMMSLDLVGDVVRASWLSREVQASERRWRTMLEKVRLLVVGFDLNGKVNYVNPNYCEVTGFAPSEVLGLQYPELVDAADQLKINELARQTAAGDEVALPPTLMKAKSGPPPLVAWSTVFVEGENSRFSGTLSIGADITEQAEAESARDRAFQEVKQLKARLEEENLYLREEFVPDEEFSEIIGQSHAIKYVLHMIRQVAGTGATVLIEGETGVGKELVARAIHRRSSRSARPFVRVNCGVLPASLVEAELFGHEKGAFTGADRLRKGRFELADGGTLFLDEVGELPLDIQAKLLRVLQEGEFERLGSSETITVDVRLLAATNRTLTEEIAAGRFRQDLFYRLHVFPITVPPLRDRKEDLPLLVRHLVRHLSSLHRRRFDEVPGSVISELSAYDWPGNVRELINVLERAVITSRGQILRLGAPLVALSKPASPEISNGEFLPMEELERRYILRVLHSTDWRIAGPSGAAEILGMNPSTLRSRIKKLQISRPRPDTPIPGPSIDT